MAIGHARAAGRHLRRSQSTYLTGVLPERARHRRQRLVLPRRVRGQVLAAVEQAGAGAQDLGASRAQRTRTSPAPTCSGGTTCTRRSDYAVTPRPMYPADGRKLPDVYTHPASCATSCRQRARPVPAVQVLGPGDRHHGHALDRRRGHVGRSSSTSPTLTLVYLPHLDYELQRLGPGRPARGDATCARWTPCAAT